VYLSYHGLVTLITYNACGLGSLFYFLAYFRKRFDAKKIILLTGVYNSGMLLVHLVYVGLIAIRPDYTFVLERAFILTATNAILILLAGPFILILIKRRKA
jgi:hypothetical protein